MVDNEMVTFTDPDNDLASEVAPKKRGRFARPTRRTTVMLIGAGVLALAVIAGATTYGFYYGAGHRALPGTMVGDHSVQGMTRGEIISWIEKTAETKKVSVTGSSVHNKTALLAEMGVKPNAKAMADKALAPNAQISNYFSAPFTTHRVNPEVTWDQPTLAAFASTLTEGIEGTFPAIEPAVAPSLEAGTFVTVDGKQGRGVPLTELIDSAKKVIATGADHKLTAEIGDVEPLLTVADAQELADAANKMIAEPVSVTAGDHPVEPNPEQRMGWVTIPAVGSIDAQPRVDAEKVKEWATAASAGLVVERVEGQRYITEAGEVVLEKVKAVDGVDVTNIDDVVERIVKATEASQPYSGTFETAVNKAGWKETVIAPGAEKLAYPAAPGERWIDVNLSNRTTTAYEGATVVHGPVLMVPGDSRTPTVTGRYAIQRKVRSDTMKGFNVDGTPYKTENVPYAMYFHSGYALHGAPWRGAFGPGVSGGSHGCVNLPPSEAGWFYNWAPVGTVVVSHH